MRNQPFSELDSFGSGEPTADPRRRLTLLTVLVALAFAIVGARVVHIQAMIPDRFLDPWRSTRIEEETVPARDGRILSRDGVVLAQDETRYDISIDYRWLESPPDPGWMKKQLWERLTPSQRKDKALCASVEQGLVSQRGKLFENLAEVSGIEQADLVARAGEIQRRIETMVTSVEQRRRERREARSSASEAWSAGWDGIAKLVIEELTTPPDRFAEDPVVLKEELQHHVLLRNVPLEVVAAIQSQPTRFPGVQVETTDIRSYPHNSLASHVLGLRRIQNRTERVAESGIERSHDAELRGVPGRLRHHEDRRGNHLESKELNPPRDGMDVTLTIDSRLQLVAEQLLDQALSSSDPAKPAPVGGCLIAMDVWSGEILVLATSPRPALAVLAQPTQEQWDELVRDPRRPLFPRGTQMALPAGSVFKVVTAIAALESGAIGPDEVLNCRGYLDRPDQFRCAIFRSTGVGHGPLTLEDALCQSCNVAFFQLARRMPQQVLADWAARFGFGQRTGIDLPGEQSGRVPSPEPWETEANRISGSTLQLAIGQGSLLVTPLQVVRMMAAVANGGYLVTPRVTQTSDAQSSDGSQARLQRIDGLSERSLTIVRRGLESVIHDPQGTGRSARVDLLRMAGKTGTAETARAADHAWLAGYVPADAPRIAFVVVLEEGGSAGTATGPLVREFVVEMLGCGALRPPAE